MVTDLAEPDHIYITLSTGQSGDPENAHFADHLARWQTGELLRVPLDPAAVEIETAQVLAPAGGAT
jgi:acyl-homoserine lactone acylase PvdQ